MMLTQRSIFFILLLLLLAMPASAQGVRQPLTIQGVHQQDAASARARAMGGTFAAHAGGMEALLLNPAGLTGLTRPEIAVAGIGQARRWAETQQWNPNRYYAGLSLYFWDPDTYNPEPLEDPDWTHNHTTIRPAFAGGAIPLRLAGRALSLGVAYHLVADLSDYDRNDNVLDPYIGQFRPDIVERPKPGEEVEVTWSRFERQREGFIQAVSPALAIELLPRLHLGLRGSYWWGSSDDAQREAMRGTFLLREDAHDYTFTEGAGSTEWSGTSDYTGWTGTIGLRLEQDAFSLGATLQLPTQLTRSYSLSGRTVADDGTTSAFSSEGEDDLTLPLQFTAGAVLRPTSTVALSVDYHVQDYGQVEIESAGSISAPDWGSVHGVRVGAEWEVRDGLFLRGGFRQDPQPFRITGSGLLGQTARGNAFSAGVGYPLGPVVLDLAYEFQRLLYQDRWESNVDYNRVRKHNLILAARYRF